MPKNEDRVRRDLEILGLELSASEDDRKKAFIKLALKLHPDRFSKNPDDSIKMQFHEVCKAYKRLTTDHCSTADWNIDKSDEIFFSLLADSLQHNSKTALYGLFTELPNHKSHFQNDNKYRCKEDAFDEEEDEDAEFDGLITILTNRLQNGKSLPAGLTQDKIFKLKEDFVKHKEAAKKCTEDEKSTTTSKKPKPPSQVPVTKPKPKSKKQILAEQRRREKEMAKIAAELDEKKRKEEEKETARRQLEEEKQRKLEEEQKRMEEERKRQLVQAKKRKEREDRERELRQQKENERLEKLKKQQEEEQRRKEEEKKRKAEEKATKSKTLREAKEKEEKEKQEQNKKQQANKRLPTNGQQYQPQYQQYQQQQQKYPREVPPRFLRQMQQRQQPNQSEGDDQLPKTQPTSKDGKISKEEADWDSGNDDTSQTSQNVLETRSKWTDNANVGNENWGQELSSGTGTLSDWGTAKVTEDWDAPSEPSFGSMWTEQNVIDDGTKIEQPAIGTIGSEVKSGKIPKKDATLFTNKAEKPSSGQFGAIGQPVSSVKEVVNDVKTLKEKDVDKEMIVAKDTLYKDVIGKNSGSDTREESLKTAKSIGPTNLDVSKLQGSKTSPKLTGWSGLDGFEPLPNYDSSTNPLPQPGPSVVDSNTKVKPKSEQTVVNTGKTIDHVVTAKELQKEVGPDKFPIEKSPGRGSDAARGADEWGWTTASSKKAKQKPTPPAPTATKEANVWMNRSLKQLIDMGFKLEDAERALKENNGIIESAVSDLLSRTDTSPVDAKKQEQNRKKEPETIESTEEKINSRKTQMNETHAAIDSSKQKKVKKVLPEGIEFPPTATTSEALGQTKPVTSRPNGSFLPSELVQGFSDNTNKTKVKPIGVIGGQLSSSSSKSSSSRTSSAQGSPRSSDEPAKVLPGPIQPPVSSLSQNSLHHISAPGSQITSSSLHQQVFPSFGSDSQSLSSQSSRIHQLLQQQPMAAIVPPPSTLPGDTSHKLPPSLFPQPPILSSVAGTVPKEPTFIPSGLPPNPNPAPQKSKLLQWTQSVTMDSKETSSSAVGQSERDSPRSGPSTASDTASTSIASMEAPVTVDPVSAKWGVIAAPRLSPTPSEFKPGVQWKPKAELERDEKRTGQPDDNKESTEQEIEPKTTPDSSVNGPLPVSDRAPSAGIIRPPPGLGNTNSFELQSNAVDPQAAGMMEKSLEQSNAKKSSIQWISLSGLKPTVDYNALRLFCQQYGIVHDFRPGQGMVQVCYNNQSQAMAACKAMSGRIIFDSNIVASLVSEDEVPTLTEAKPGLPQPQPKPFIHNQFPGMQPNPFWDQNGQIGTMNPPMNPNVPFPHPQPIAGMPPGGMLGLGPHLGQWSGGRSDPLVNHSPYWPMTMQPQGLLNQVPGYGPWSSNNAPQVTGVNVTTAHNAVSPSTGTRLLPDGLFNATESI